MIFEDTTKSTEAVAQELLGYLLVHETPEGKTSGWIVETEAYIGIPDEAAHSYGGKNTPRLQAMFQQPGTIYTYQMHTHTLLNVVTQAAGTPHAVLIRAVEPVEGLDRMQLRRKNQTDFNLTNGPGKLTQAMGITMDEYGTQITEPPLYIDFSQRREPNEIETSPRIGIPNKGEWTERHLRYTVKGNPYVSGNKTKVDTINHGWRIDSSDQTICIK